MFDVEWLTDPEFSLWLSGLDGDEFAYCKLCKKEIKVTKGKGALRAHANGLKHSELAYEFSKRSADPWGPSSSKNSNRKPKQHDSPRKVNQKGKVSEMKGAPIFNFNTFNVYATACSSGTSHLESVHLQSTSICSQSRNLNVGMLPSPFFAGNTSSALVSSLPYSSMKSNKMSNPKRTTISHSQSSYKYEYEPDSYSSSSSDSNRGYYN